MMFDMQIWQQVVVMIVAIVSVGWMSLTIVRIFSRPASGSASVRPGTAVESGLVGGTVPPGASVFDTWSYRVGARFAGRARIAVYDDRVAVAGPRVPRGLYELWMWAQGLLLALVPPALVAAVVALDWRWLVAAFAIWIVSFGISFGGAGLWPGLGEILADDGYFKAVEFPLSSVSEVDVGKGWAKGGLEIVLLPYRAGVDQMAKGHAVSFFAPDEYGREVRFALHMNSDADARELSRLLSAAVGREIADPGRGPDATSAEGAAPSSSVIAANRSMPPGTIIPELAYPDLDATVTWLRETFGFQERLRIADHRSQLTFDDGSIIAVARAGADRSERSEVTHSVMVRVADVDRHYEHAKGSGAHIVHPPETYAYGERQYTVSDPGGHHWTFTQSVADVAPEDWGGRLLDSEGLDPDSHGV